MSLDTNIFVLRINLNAYYILLVRHRWDQKFYTFLIVPKAETKKIDPPRELQALVEATGGELFICRGLHDTLSSMKGFVNKSLVPSVVVKIAAEVPGMKQSEVEIKVKLAVKSSAEWPLPEAFWVDKNVDNLPPRSALPQLRLEKTYGPCLNEMALLRELDLFHDSYDLSMVPFIGSIGANEDLVGKGTDILRILGLNKDERCMVYVKGSHRLDGNRF
jgi:hypothetical protein